MAAWERNLPEAVGLIDPPRHGNPGTKSPGMFGIWTCKGEFVLSAALCHEGFYYCDPFIHPAGNFQVFAHKGNGYIQGAWPGGGWGLLFGSLY